MKAISFSQHGPPDVLQLIDINVPTLGEEDVLIRNQAIRVNFVDVQHRNIGIVCEAKVVIGTQTVAGLIRKG